MGDDVTTFYALIMGPGDRPCACGIPVAVVRDAERVAFLLPGAQCPPRVSLHETMSACVMAQVAAGSPVCAICAEEAHRHAPEGWFLCEDCANKGATACYGCGLLVLSKDLRGHDGDKCKECWE